MKDQRKKDNLTDLVDILASSEVDADAPSTGQVVTNEGETVTLSAEDDKLLDGIVRKLIKQFKRKKQQEKEVREYLVKQQDKKLNK